MNNQLPKIVSNYKDALNYVGNEPKNEDIENTKILKIGNDEGKVHFVLHFDINETILVGDNAGGDSVEDCLNKVIAKSAFVKIPDGSENLPTKDVVPSLWWDGTPLTMPSDGDTLSSSPLPPLYTGWDWPKGTCPYYRTAYKKNAKRFTDSNEHGSIYRPLYEHLQQKFSNLVTSSAAANKSDERSSPPLPTSHPFFRMLPSFFHTLVKLQEEGIEYTLVLRTFGSDLEDIALALTDFANGKHPLFPNFREPKLILGEDKLFKGRWRKVKNNNDSFQQLPTNDSCTSSVFDLFPWNCDELSDMVDDDESNEKTAITSGDNAVLNVIESLSICGIQDDYFHWKDNNYAPWSGKPLWLHSKHEKGTATRSINNQTQNSKHNYYHMFFDDNIHNDENDSIVAVRTSVGDKWVSLNGSQTIDQQGIHVFRVPTVEVILNNDWFLQQISKIEAKYDM